MEVGTDELSYQIYLTCGTLLCMRFSMFFSSGDLRMRTINLHQLATFQVVAKHCSYVRAAEELHFSQPAVSAQIHQLEESMGIKLFDKIGRKTHLTQAGEELYLYSQKIFAIIDETMETMEALRSPYHGRLSVGADTTVGTYVVPKLLGNFHQLYSDVE